MRTKLIAPLVVAAAAVAAPLHAQNMDRVKITVTPVSGPVYMLAGAGGNMGLLVGDDGALLIDDEFAPLTDRIRKAVATVTGKPIRLVVNTHWHGDHTGGNENMREGGAIVVSQENVRKRMSADQFNAVFDDTTLASPGGALPVITFADSLTFHWDGETLRVIHLPHAHTDGDAVIRFAQADVIHTGDILFSGMYPLIDISTGGSVKGVIAGADSILALCDANTRLIPGHGPLATPDDLRAYRNMLALVSARVEKAIGRGMTEDQVIATKPTAEYDATWGGGFMKPDVFVKVLYRDLARP